MFLVCRHHNWESWERIRRRSGQWFSGLWACYSYGIAWRNLTDICEKTRESCSPAWYVWWRKCVSSQRQIMLSPDSVKFLSSPSACHVTHLGELFSLSLIHAFLIPGFSYYQTAFSVWMSQWIYDVKLVKVSLSHSMNNKSLRTTYCWPSPSGKKGNRLPAQTHGGTAASTPKPQFS